MDSIQEIFWANLTKLFKGRFEVMPNDKPADRETLLIAIR
jgi:hypothetical protein